MQLADENFSVIALRKRHDFGLQSAHRFDLIINTMFKSAVREHSITVNNPSIWRPDAWRLTMPQPHIRARLRRITIIGNISTLHRGNYTAGEVADLVRSAVEERLATG